jgi:hypothetical protein
LSWMGLLRSSSWKEFDITAKRQENQCKKSIAPAIEPTCISGSPWSKIILWSTKLAVTWSITFSWFLACKNLSLRHLPLARPNAFSTRTRHWDNLLLKISWAGVRWPLLVNGVIIYNLSDEAYKKVSPEKQRNNVKHKYTTLTKSVTV